MLPASSSVEDQAKAVFGAYYDESGSDTSTKTVWKSTFKAIDSVDGGRVDGVIDGVVLLASRRRRRVDGIVSMAWPSGPTHGYEKLVEIGDDAEALKARVGAGPTLSGLQFVAPRIAAWRPPTAAAFENLEANKANARSQLSETRRGPPATSGPSTTSCASA